MKKYIIKYETHWGDCKVVTLYAVTERHALSMISYKEIYWIRLETPKTETQ